MGAIAENPARVASEDFPSVEERRTLIERVAASEHFRRSARLRDFLLYVGRESLKDGRTEIHEQEIGARVFGREDSYDRTADNIVRVNATELRKRIDAYFATAGVRETLVFEIPRGGYMPVFRRRLPDSSGSSSPPAEESPEEILPPPVPEVRRRVRFLAHPLWAFVSLSLAIACAVLIQKYRAVQTSFYPWQSRPAVAAFWRGFLDPRRDTAVVMSDDSASVIEDITHRPVTLNDYVTRDFLRQIQSSDLSADRKADLNEIFSHNLTNFGAARAVQIVTGEIPPDYHQYLTLARNFTPDEIQRNNVVLLGGKKAIPWNELFVNDLNFVTDYDDAHSHMFVRNRNPKPGELPIYPAPGVVDDFSGYATVAYLPNPSRTGHVILLAGTDTDATAAAAGFLTSEDRMEKLQKTWHVDRFPYFEAVLKVTYIRGTFFDAECIAYRTYPERR